MNWGTKESLANIVVIILPEGSRTHSLGARAFFQPSSSYEVTWFMNSAGNNNNNGNYSAGNNNNHGNLSSASWLKALNKRNVTRIMYVEMESVLQFNKQLTHNVHINKGSA